MRQSLVHDLFGFRFAHVCGLLIAMIVWGRTSELRPLSSFLFSPNLYFIAIMVALTFRVLVWLIVYKGSFYEFGYHIKLMLKDCFIIVAVTLSCLGCLFLINSFLLS